MSETEALDDQVASHDEYDIALAHGVDDESLLGAADPQRYAITSYGADYSVEVLLAKLKSGSFRVPDFQRRFIWSKRHASKFIESLLMGLPVPGIFLYREKGTNKHLVIDGQQRLRSLHAFLNGKFGRNDFRLIGVRNPWEGKNFSELDAADRLKIEDSTIHATIFQQDDPKEALDSIYFVFERINSGGIRLSPQEIRSCITSGPFNEMVDELNKNVAWRRIFGKTEDKRGKDQELIIRFFALLEDSNNYRRPMATFLNTFSVAANKFEAAKLNSLRNSFLGTIEVVDRALSARAFRPVRSINAAVFDGVMTGLARRLAQPPSPSDQAVATAYDRLIGDQGFKATWERATADEETVKQRLSAAHSAFSPI